MPRASTRRARPAPPAPQRNADITHAVEAWFAASARSLPWRPPSPTTPRNPYHALVSEAMLQQTQVSRVADRFREFIARFPTVESLAAADDSDVLALWSGLGYYRRARNLHAAAKALARDHGGVIPADIAALRRLPGVGRYTAGAIASIAFNRPEPIVDGNVARVLLRVGNRPPRHADPSDPATQAWLWGRADDLVRSARSPAAFNEGLMELGATVCTPRSPRCDACPLAPRCRARAAGTQDKIPRPKAPAQARPLYCASILATRGAPDLLLVEQRSCPETHGPMWQGLWQAPTLERDDRPPTAAEVAAALGVCPDRAVLMFTFPHKTTHRAVSFDVWSVKLPRRAGNPPRGRWLPASEVARLPLSNPQRRILLAPPSQSAQS